MIEHILASNVLASVGAQTPRTPKIKKEETNKTKAILVKLPL